ncbi:hypothetical protein [Candidatus Acidianus copahuensis]|nr:hypothetical protein [Candidatus Acidianus copahuensis]
MTRKRGVKKENLLEYPEEYLKNEFPEVYREVECRKSRDKDLFYLVKR